MLLGRQWNLAQVLDLITHVGNLVGIRGSWLPWSNHHCYEQMGSEPVDGQSPSLWCCALQINDSTTGKMKNDASIPYGSTWLWYVIPGSWFQLPASVCPGWPQVLSQITESLLPGRPGVSSWLSCLAWPSPDRYRLLRNEPANESSLWREVHLFASQLNQSIKKNYFKPLRWPETVSYIFERFFKKDISKFFFYFATSFSVGSLLRSWKANFFRFCFWKLETLPIKKSSLC